MCREMLVLEEKELACVEVKGKMEGGRLTKPGRERVRGSAVWIRGRARVRAGRRKGGGGEEKEARRDRYPARGEARSASRHKQRNRGPEQTIPSPGNTDQSGFRQSRLVQALPTGSLDPEATLFPTVPRSVGRDDKEEVETGPLLSGARVLVRYTHSDLLAWKCSARVI